LAINANSETTRAHVVELAKQWTKLAAERENLARVKAIRTPERTH
jgi:hypothetical protein